MSKGNSHTFALFETLNEYFPPALQNVLILLHHNLYSSCFSSLNGNLSKPMFVFCQSLSYCAFVHTGMEQYFPFPPILSCFGRSSTVFSWYIVDSTTMLLHHNFYSSGFSSLSGNLSKTMFVFCQSLSYCATVHTGMEQYFPIPSILSCFGRSSTVFSWYIVDSIGLFDDSSGFPLFTTKSAVLFYRLGPRFYARKKITSKISEKVYKLSLEIYWNTSQETIVNITGIIHLSCHDIFGEI